MKQYVSSTGTDDPVQRQELWTEDEYKHNYNLLISIEKPTKWLSSK